MSQIVSKFQELGLTLPACPAPVAAYVPATRFGDTIIVSGQLPSVKGDFSAFTGVVPLDLIDMPADILQGFHVQGVQGPLAFPPAGDDSGFRQHLHIVGQSGLGDFKTFQQYAAAHFPAGKHIHDPKSLRVGNGFQHFCCIDINLLHYAPHIEFFLCFHHNRKIEKSQYVFCPYLG